MRSRTALRKLIQQVSCATSLPDIYRAALDTLHQSLDVERSALLVTDEQDVLHFVAWQGLSDTYRAAMQHRMAWRPYDADAAPVTIADVTEEGAVAEYRELMAQEQIRALGLFPLRFADRVLGKLMLYYSEPHTFSEDEIAALELIASQVAFAVEHFRVSGELEQRLSIEQESRKAREFLAGASRVLATTRNPADTVRKLARILVPRVADWCIVQVVDAQGAIQPVEVAHKDSAKVELAWQLARRWQAPYENGTAARAVKSGEATLVQCIDRDMLARRASDPEHLRMLESLGLCSGITVPLQARGRILGALTVMSAESGNTYGQDDLAFVGEIASWAALALDNAELYAQAQETRAIAERARERLQTLAEVHDDLASSLEPDAALRLFARRLASRVADYCFTYAFDGRSIRRVGLAHRDPAKLAYVEALAAADPPCLEDEWGVGPVIRTGEATLIAKVEMDAIVAGVRSDSQKRALRALGPRSMLLMPLKARGRTVGAIALVADASSSHVFDRDDLELARELASHAALLIDNSRLYSDARTAIRARDDMIAVVSHDLRNPLQSIASAASVLQLEPSRDRHDACVAAIRVATEQMDRLLRDLLDITQIDAGQLFVRRERTEVAFLVSEARMMFQQLARERSLTLECSVANGLPALDVDRGRILQVFSNLLGNALKFVPAGGRIEVTAIEEHGRVRFAIADTGPGIDAANLPRVFDRFWRADRRRDRGAGLGLAVAKGIIEAHGGTIGVDSVRGKGSTFWFVLDAEPEARREQPMAGNGPILVVDDDAPFREAVAEVLRGSGYEVVSAHDSAEALELLASDTPPSLVILDGMTPLMDGRRLSDVVKDMPQLGSVPVVLSTTFGKVGTDDPGDGAAGYLEKPVRPSQVLGLAAALCHRSDRTRTRLN
ncbi:MAG TPA: GAF domain-containing protein [Woeseiaceae bacterium]